MGTAVIRRRLSDLDAKILELRSQQKMIMDALEHDRRALRRELHSTSEFPVLTLPVEITTEIFTQSIQLKSHDDPRRYTYETLAILQTSEHLILMRVCREWRDIVLSTPTLWTKLDLRFDNIPIDQLPEVDGFIERWLSRAADCPLSLFFRAGREIDFRWEGPFSLNRLCGVIHAYSHRIRHLQLDMHEKDIRQLGLDLTAFPLLECATLDCEKELGGNTPPPDPIFGNAPQLQNLNVLHNVSYHVPAITVNNFTFPWLQLTKFEGGIRDLDLFRLATNLIEVTCYFDYFSAPTSTVTHSRLLFLKLMEGSPGLILEHLILPALRSLDIWEVDQDAYIPLSSFLIRSSPPLMSLSVLGDDVVFPYWHACIGRLGSTLENLEITSPCPKAMRSIFDLGERSPFSSLSNLRTVTLRQCPPSNNYPLVKFLCSRSSRLKSFRMYWDTDPSLETYMYHPVTFKFDTIAGHLAGLVQSGMNIHVGT
ncbi:hypothetical protein C8R43DRAFT_1047665 [Mycena crocata]|nr:hypothetical protein C8R43DRAFT_1047665 [Mycena crocata]